MWAFGAMARLGPAPTGGGRRQAIPAEPVLEGAFGGDRERGVDTSQFDPDAAGPPAGMLASELEDRVQERGHRIRTATAGVITGDQLGEGPVAGPGSLSPTDQISNGADGEREPSRDLRRGGPEPSHLGDRQTQRQFRGARHRSRLPGPQKERFLILYKKTKTRGTFASVFCTELRFA